ncbi:hypothetical protein JVU11DRAFT_183 [Chiua virens]|nr:hypothetical protein JVU11DRAFT_183 [Chiua virens]
MSPLLTWQPVPRHPASGPPPLVNTEPEYSGRPTPPATPVNCAAPITNNYTPCPPTPEFVDVQSPYAKSHNLWTSVKPRVASVGPPAPRSTLELNRPTSFADLPVDQPRYNDPQWSVYSREIFASPSPALTILKRAIMDRSDLRHRPVVPTIGEPHTSESVPKTGINAIDEQSSGYYAKRPYPSLLRNPDYYFAYYYPIKCVKAVQCSLRMDWPLVFPGPFPPSLSAHAILLPPSI